MRSLPEVRALDRDLGVDLVLIMTFKCLKPREDAGYPAPRVGVGGGMGFPGGSVGKESACDAEDLSSIPGLGRFPGGGHGNPLQHSCLENLHGQRSLESCSS